MFLFFLSQSPAEKYFFTEINPYKWCLIFLSSCFLGLEDKVEISLYTCMLSALMISPLIFFANCMANLDFPEAVGPAKRIIFLDKINLF